MNNISSVTSRTESCNSAFTKLIPSAGRNRIKKQNQIIVELFQRFNKHLKQGEGHEVCSEIIVLLRPARVFVTRECVVTMVTTRRNCTLSGGRFSKAFGCSFAFQYQCYQQLTRQALLSKLNHRLITLYLSISEILYRRISVACPNKISIVSLQCDTFFECCVSNSQSLINLIIFNNKKKKGKKKKEKDNHV